MRRVRDRRVHHLRRVAAIFVLLTVLAPLALAGTAAPARADNPGGIFGVPVFVGFITPDGHFFAMVGQSNFGQFQPVQPGSQIFGTSFTLVLFGLTKSNLTCAVQYVQFPGGEPQWVNTSFVVPAENVAVDTIGFPATDHYIPANLTIDGVTLTYTVETPILLLPIGNLVNGGIDLLILAIIAEILVFGLPAIVAARWLSFKALYAPRVRAILWLHGIVLGMLSFVVLDFPLVNQVFGAWEWFIYPLPIVVFLFFWSCSLFNRADVVEVLRVNTAGGHRLSFDRWEIRVGRNQEGDLVILGRRWRDWVANILGKWVVLAPHNAEDTGTEPQPYEMTMRHVISRTDFARRRLRWPSPTKEHPEDDFRIRNRQDRGDEDPGFVYLVASTDPFDVEWSRWSIHRTVQVPAAVDRHGVNVPAHPKRVLSLPHILAGHAEVRLATIHYVPAVAAAMGWRSAEDLAAVAEKRSFQVYTLKAHSKTEVARQVEQTLIAYLDLTTSTDEDLSDEQADAEVERRSGDRGRRVPNGRRDGDED